MKRFVTYALFMVLSAVSCREKIDLPVIDEIAFSAPEVAETKSILITDKTEMVSGVGELAYSVFASRYIPDQDGSIDMNTHEQFMINVEVYSKDNGSTWKYDGEPFYWSPGAVHNFFAVYPYYDEESDTYDMGLSFSIDEERHALKMTGKHEIDSETVICTGTDEDGKNICPDILYGVMSYPVPYAVGEDRDPVRFNMNHALAAVSFRLRNASENTITGVTAEPVTGFINASGHVHLSHEGPIWDKESFQTLDDHKFYVPAVTSDEIASGAYYEPDGKKYWYTALMIPQEFGTYPESPYFNFTVAMSGHGNKEYTVNFKDYAVSNVAEYGFTYLPGYHYVYNLNITATDISCNVEIVPWIEDEPIELN